MSEIQYHNPKENMERGDDVKHTIDIVVEGELLGRAEVEYFSKPIPFYQLSDLYVEFEHHGKGYSSKIMDFLEKMLKQKGKAGVLVDAIDLDTPAAGMYERRGWIPVPGGHGQMVYNLPKGTTPAIFNQYQERQTDVIDRPAYRKSIGLDK